MSISFLKHDYNFSITFNVILRSISGTGKINSSISERKFSIVMTSIFWQSSYCFSVHVHLDWECHSFATLGLTQRLLRLISLVVLEASDWSRRSSRTPRGLGLERKVLALMELRCQIMWGILLSKIIKIGQLLLNL